MRPTAKAMLPHQSILAAARLPLSRRLKYPQIVPMMPKGTETQKTSRQSTTESSPPAISPMNDPPIAATWLIPMAMPRWSDGNASTRIALELAKSIAPPTPCTRRHSTSQSAPVPPW